MKKVELYRSLSQFDLEDTDLFIEFANDLRKRLLEKQEAADTVHAEAAKLVLPEGLTNSVTQGQQGGYRSPNSARGLAEQLLRTNGRFTKDEFFKFLRAKRPDLGKGSFDSVLSVIQSSGFAKKDGMGDTAVFTLVEKSAN